MVSVRPQPGQAGDQQPDELERMCIEAAKQGRAAELASGMAAMCVTAALVFLRGAMDQDGGISETEQVRNVGDALIARGRARVAGQLVGEKLCPDSQANANTLADAVAVCVMSQVNLVLTAKACGADWKQAAKLGTSGVAALLKSLGCGVEGEVGP